MADDDSRQKIDSKSTQRQVETPVTFTELAEGKTELTIEHQGQLYRLRVTKNGKLLLNK